MLPLWHETCMVYDLVHGEAKQQTITIISKFVLALVDEILLMPVYYHKTTYDDCVLLAKQKKLHSICIEQAGKHTDAFLDGWREFREANPQGDAFADSEEEEKRMMAMLGDDNNDGQDVVKEELRAGRGRPDRWLVASVQNKSFLS